MATQSTVKKTLRFVEKILDIVDGQLKTMKTKKSDQSHVTSAKKEIYLALKHLDGSILDALIEYQRTLEDIHENGDENARDNL